MAESAAHLTTNLMARPSLFEVLASDSLINTFYPALKRISNFLVVRNPERFKFQARFYDEIFLVLNALVQNHYLKVQGGSIWEVFYGLTRLATRSNTFGKREHRLSLLTLVLFPYLENKLSSIIAQYEEELLGESQIENKETKRFLVRSHKYVRAFWEMLKLVQFIRYLAKYSQSHSPILQLTGMHLTFADVEQQISPWTWSEVFRGRIKMATFLGSLLLRGLESSAFILQFLQWWYTEAENSDLTKLPVPKAPAPDPNGETFMGICPICLQKWKIPTACSLSGYVYCYKCIINHIKMRGTCPVSNYGITEEDLIRIYEN